MGEGFDWEFDWLFDWAFDWGFDWGSLSLTSGRHGKAMYAASFTKNSHGLTVDAVVAVGVDDAVDFVDGAVVAVVITVDNGDDDGNNENDDAYSRLR